MAITRDDVLHVAKLARLSLTEPVVSRMVRDLGRILGFVEVLSSVDTTGVEPTAYLEVEAAPFRPDVVEPSVDREQALQQAPRRSEETFAVPGFVDEG